MSVKNNCLKILGIKDGVYRKKRLEWILLPALLKQGLGWKNYYSSNKGGKNSLGGFSKA